MLNRLMRRLAGLAIAGLALASMSLTPAWADKAAEDFVARSAPQALNALSAPGLTQAQRSQKFSELMTQFADLPTISTFVLGRYARALRSDPALARDWQATFREYAIANYEAQLETFSGTNLRVLPGSQDICYGVPEQFRRANSADCLQRGGRFNSQVTTEIIGADGQQVRAIWRLQKTASSDFRVIDVAVDLDDQVVWLGIAQRADFNAFLSANNGDIRKLITEVKRQTGVLRARAAQRTAQAR